MKKFKTISISAIAMIVSASVWANSNAHGNDQAEMPMVNDSENSTMMDSQATENKITTGDRHKQHHEKSMMGEGSHGMMMDPHMMHMMQHYKMGQHQHHDMASMGGSSGGMMMKPEMMQKRQQHMENMEQRLANIEALLTKLVELQKP